jgi:hypothetical protein
MSDTIAKWNAGSWSAIPSIGNAHGSIIIGNDGSMYIGGEFIIPPEYPEDSFPISSNSPTLSDDSNKFIGRCKHCGVKYCEDEKYCDGCGAPL